MILDLRIKWVEKWKRQLNHCHNGIKRLNYSDKRHSYISDGREDINYYTHKDWVRISGARNQIGVGTNVFNRLCKMFPLKTAMLKDKNGHEIMFYYLPDILKIEEEYHKNKKNWKPSPKGGYKTINW